nr:endo-1,4-beta-xylanase [Bacteroidales bacterium]
NDPTIGANADKVHSALQALAINNVGTGFTGGSAWKIQVGNNNKVDVTAGSEYRVGLWVKSPDGGTTLQVECRWDVQGETSTTNNYNQVTGITDEWTYLYYDITAPEKAYAVQIVLDCAYEEVNYYIDDVQFMPKPVESFIDKNSILTNGDFEEVADGFPANIHKGNGGEYISLSTEEAHSGTNSIKVDNTSPVGTGGDAWKIQFGNQYNTPTPLEGGKTYRYGVWVKSPDAAEGAQIQLYAKHYTGDTAGTENYRQAGPVTSDWSFIYTDIEVPEGEDGMYLTIQAAYAEGTFYFDDWQCFPIEASTASIKAAKGFGKYPSWNRPAPAKVVRRGVDFENNAKFDGELVDDAVGAAYKNFVYGMVEHFDVYAWDVVNETFTDGGDFRNTSNTEESKDKHVYVWGKHYADTKTWVDKAFAYATDAAALYGKTPVLYINDYNLETSDAKRAAFCAYAKGNEQVTGVGTQMHLNLGTPDLEAKIEASLKDLVATGKMVRISELDIVSTDEAAQAEMYKYIFAKYIELVPEAQRGGITIWGINDKDSWLGEASAPLLWKGNKYEKKLAYETLYVYLCELAGIDPYQAEEDE